ncbi:MAG: ribonuclease HI family protein [Acidimicrobiia bacterium]|nr:ribonuclease HI family protein [Acidimicrobiia bacterium]
MTRMIVYTDGASRGNPGAASIGAAIYAEEGGEVIGEVSEAIGHATNNVAEYKAVIAGLAEAQRLGATEVELRADSLLLVRQLTGEYRVKAPGLKPLAAQATRLLRGFESTTIVHVRREFNEVADALANAALDR